MSISVVPVPFDADKNGVVMIELREPGIVRYFAWGAVERSVRLPGSHGMEERLVAFVEVDPDVKTLRLRTFAVLPLGAQLMPNPTVRATYRGTAHSGNPGAIVCVYEMENIVDAASIEITPMARPQRAFDTTDVDESGS
jgi:hypothetical protein